MSFIISKKDEKIFWLLFYRGGYVLDFTSEKFDQFTTWSIGIPLMETYHLPKGKSLNAYLNEANDESRTKILLDLFHYYEENMEYEYNKDYEDLENFGGSSRYDERYRKIYLKCKEILDKLKNENLFVKQASEELKEKFSSEYMNKQITLMMDIQDKNPTSAIGKAKELIESCCKTILDEKNIQYDKNDDLPKLTNKTLDALSLLPSHIKSTDPGAKSIKTLLGCLKTITTNLAEIRNIFGEGHGKSASFKGLEARHARLAVGCSITFVEFIWNTFETSKNI